jgi:transcriptional regulator with XRE-family HTH domain
MKENHSELTIFEQLEKIRKEKKISLEEMSENTRIPLKYLEAIEKGDILSVPRVYDKLFFKTYLHALGVNKKEYYEQFLECRNQLRQEKTTTINELITPVEKQKNLFNYRNLLVILPVLFIVMVIFILIINTKDVNTLSDEKVKEIDFQNLAQEIEQREKIITDSMKIEQSGQKELSLKIKSLKKTWLRVIIDKKDTSEYLLDKDRTIQLVAENFFEFLVGRADGILITMNNQVFSALGKDSEVIQYMLIDSSGIITKRNVLPKIKSIKNE